jgi:hypothetical protein
LLPEGERLDEGLRLPDVEGRLVEGERVGEDELRAGGMLNPFAGTTRRRPNLNLFKNY